jgi:hypothetical protein
MKKFILITASTFLLIIILALALPFIFKDKIFEAADKALHQNLNARVILKPENIRLSGLRAFPHLQLSIKDLTVIGIDEFASDTLYTASNTEIRLDIWKILFDKEMEITRVKLENPNLKIVVLEGGKSNYDIYKSTEAQDGTTDLEASDARFALNSFILQNARIIYDDQDLKFYTLIEGLEATGTGDFASDIFDLNTELIAKRLDLSFEGINYLSRKEAEARATIAMNLADDYYTFKDNEIRLNEFKFAVDGGLKLFEEGVDMNMQFHTIENKFKNLLSLLQGMYGDSFKDLKADGIFDFEGQLKGFYAYEGDQIPAFLFRLNMANGSFRYPDLPSAVEKVNLNLLVENKTGKFEETLIDFNQLSAMIGNNPISGRLKILNLKNYELDTELKAKLNLQELMQVFPMDGYQLAGNLDLNLKANGIYDSLKNIIPKLDGRFTIANGRIKTPDLPEAIESLSFESRILNETGRLNDTKLTVNPFSFLFQGESLEGLFSLSNFEDYTWDAFLKGTINLGEITKIVPLEAGMKIAGVLKGELKTSGKYSDLEKGRYGQIPTSGKFDLTSFAYSSPDLEQEVSIKTASMSFSPERMDLSNIDMQAGKSDFKGSGYISNYLNYFLGDNARLTGRFTTQSNYVDLNEWMSDTGAASTDTLSANTAFIIPENIDIEWIASINQLDYDKFKLSNINGAAKVADGVARMQGVQFEMLKGLFAMNGSYDSRNEQQPAFDFDLSILNLPIQQAFQQIEMVKAFAPIARHAEGLFNTSIKISGLLGQDLSPVLSSLKGRGMVKLVDAQLQGAPVVNAISQFAKSDTRQFSLKDFVFQADFNNGRLAVQPFNLKWGDYASTISGSTGFDGSLNWDIQLVVPANKLGSAASGIIASQLGRNVQTANEIKLDLKMTGLYDRPQIAVTNKLDQSVASFFGIDTGGRSVNQMAADTLRSTVDSVKAEIRAEVQQNLDSLKKVASDTLKQGIQTGTQKAVQGLRDALLKTPPKKTNDTTKVNEGGGLD